MENNSRNAGGGVGIATVLAIVFIVLKLCNLITWSWVWVLSPLWISFGLILAILLIMGLVIFIKVAIDEALKCKETGEEKNIVFGLTGTGYFDMVAYQKYNDGDMIDYIPTDEELEKSFATLPQVN